MTVRNLLTALALTTLVGCGGVRLAALTLLSFGRAFDPSAYATDTSQAGRVTYSDAQGAVVADVVVMSTPTDGFVATEMQVCKSALKTS